MKEKVVIHGKWQNEGENEGELAEKKTLQGNGERVEVAKLWQNGHI